MPSILPPEEWRGRAVSTLEMLMFLREQVRQGAMVELFIGMPAYVMHATIETLESFIDGMRFMLACHGLHDTDYEGFLAWLRDEKGEVGEEGGWAERCLAECGGDHAAAIARYLDLVAEFVELKQASAPGGGSAAPAV